MFGVAMGSPAPMKISFGARKGSAMVVDIAQLGGDLEMLLFMGPSKKDVATQFVQTFGKHASLTYILSGNKGLGRYNEFYLTSSLTRRSEFDSYTLFTLNQQSSNTQTTQLTLRPSEQNPLVESRHPSSPRT